MDGPRSCVLKKRLPAEARRRGVYGSEATCRCLVRNARPAVNLLGFPFVELEAKSTNNGKAAKFGQRLRVGPQDRPACDHTENGSSDGRLCVHCVRKSRFAAIQVKVHNDTPTVTLLGRIARRKCGSRACRQGKISRDELHLSSQTALQRLEQALCE
jgi:hypothetical protein